MIEQRIIDNELYTITIFERLTEEDKIDLEECIKRLQEHKEYNRIQSSKFVIRLKKK